jgi:hypothetical protein
MAAESAPPKAKASPSGPLKGPREAFARFAEDPSRDKFRELMQGHLGEARNLDFKEAWPDGPALAKQILGLANTDGGVLIIGVQEDQSGSLNPVGLAKLTDKADVLNSIKKFLPSELLARVHPLDFVFEASEYPKIVGKSFQVLLVEFNPEHIPFVAMRSSTGLRESAIYVRRDGLTEEASHSEVQALINKRIETRYSTSSELTLKKHIEQLRTLYAEIPEFATGLARFGLTQFSALRSTRNSFYPTESVNEFLARMVEAKKGRIARVLDLDD